MQTSWRSCPDEASERGFSSEGCAAPGCRGWWRQGFLHTAGSLPCRLRQPGLPEEQLCSETATSSWHRHPEKPPCGWRSRVSAHRGQATAFLASVGRGLGDTGKRGTICPIFTPHVHGPPSPSRCPPFGTRGQTHRTGSQPERVAAPQPLPQPQCRKCLGPAGVSLL